MAYGDQPRAARPDRLRRPGLDGLRPISPRFKRYYRTPRTAARLRLRPGEGEGRSSRRAAGTARRRRARRTASRPSSSSTRSPTARSSRQMARRVGGRRGEGRHRHRPRVHLGRRAQQPHLRERQDEGHCTRRTTTPSCGTGTSAARRPTPIMEVLLSNDASSDSFYDSKAYDTALHGARKAATTRGGTVAAVRKAEPGSSSATCRTCRSCILNAVDVIRTRHLARLAAARRRPTASRSSRSRQQILALKPGPAPVASAPGAAGRPSRRRRLRLADDAALRADRLRADLARDHRVVVHRERAQEDRAPRVD